VGGWPDAYEKSADVEVGLDFERGYEHLKRQEGEILRYVARIELQPLGEGDVSELARLQRLTRGVIYCNKSLKDIRHDLRELRLNAAPVMNELYELQREYHRNAYQNLLDLLLADHAWEYVLEELEQLDAGNDQHYDAVNRLVQTRAALESSDTALISLQLNVNREIRLAYRQMLKSVKSLILDKTVAGNISLQSKLPVSS
jgi:hypothetical protein